MGICFSLRSVLTLNFTLEVSHCGCTKQIFKKGKSESSYDQDVPVDQDIKLQVLHAFKDNSKTAVSIETCQNGRYSAILDSHHRVLVQVINF